MDPDVTHDAGRRARRADDGEQRPRQSDAAGGSVGHTHDERVQGDHAHTTPSQDDRALRRAGRRVTP